MNDTCFCGQSLKKHLKCHVCQALCGPGHPERSQLVRFRGATICQDCRRRWLLLEQNEKRTLIYIEFKTGSRKPDSKSGQSLTPGEIKILNLAYRGLSYKQIAWERKIKVRTVKNYMVNIFLKLQVNSRGEAVYKAIQMKLIQVNMEEH